MKGKVVFQQWNGVDTSGNRPVVAEKPLKIAIKWALTSGEPAAESRSYMLFFPTNDHANLNLLFY